MPWLVKLGQRAAGFQAHTRWFPSPGNVLCAVVTIMIVVWVTGAWAAVPMPAPLATSTTTIPYQGRLATAQGTPLTAVLPMRFRLYASATGGTALWDEQWTGSASVGVQDGLFNVLLGSRTTLPVQTLAQQRSLWVGVSINTDAEMTPRTQLGSVPFALQALMVPDASITAAKLASSAKPVMSYVRASNSLTLDGTERMVPGTYEQIAVSVPSTLIVQATFSFVLNRTGNAKGMIMVDNAVVSSEAHMGMYTGGNAAVGTVALKQLEPGFHVIALVASSDSGALVGIQSAYTYQIVPR